MVTRNRQAKSKVNLKFVFCALCHLEFNADFVLNQVMPILSDAKKLSEMSKISASFGHKDSADDLAKLVLSIAREGKS